MTTAEAAGDHLAHEALGEARCVAGAGLVVRHGARMTDGAPKWRHVPRRCNLPMRCNLAVEAEDDSGEFDARWDQGGRQPAAFPSAPHVATVENRPADGIDACEEHRRREGRQRRGTGGSGGC